MAEPQELSIGSKVRLASGFEMPVLGLGVYQNWECYPGCITAIEAGYRHIDSARYYENEAEVGRAVRECGVDREGLFVTSKIYHPDFGYESTLRCFEESYQKFALSYIDLYLIHSPLSGKQRRLDTWRALIKKRDVGKVRSIGVSNYGIKHMEEIREAGLEMPVVNQIELHPFCQQRPIVEYCRTNGIIVQAYCPLIRGQLDNLVFKEVAQKHNKSVAQVLIRWSLQHGFIPLPKSSRSERIRENASVFDFALDDEDMAQIDSLDRGDDGAIQWNPIHAE